MKVNNRSDTFAYWILTAMTLLCLCPFLNKAFHIDDPLFIWIAKHLQSHPWNFYDFNVNWYGVDETMAAAMQNPPLAAYYLALVASVLGWSEPALHAGFLVPAVAAVLGTFRLAKRFCVHPLVAALATIVAPGFLVSGTSVMCDTMMVALWVWALVFWMEGLAKNDWVKLGMSAIFITACGLTKYFGFALVPLLLAYSLMERRKIGAWLAFFLIPVIVLIGYEWLTHKLYGRGSLLDGITFAKNHQTHGLLVVKILKGLAFSGGSVAILLFAAWLLWSKRALVAGFVIFLGIGIVLVLAKRINFIKTFEDGHINWAFVLQMSLFVTIGVSIFALALGDLIHQQTSGALLLFLWILGTFVFGIFVCWEVSIRYLLPMVPAVSILLVKRLEVRKKLNEQNIIGPMFAPLGISLIVALLVAWSDFNLANSARTAAAVLGKELRIKSPSGTIWFEGHWGFQFYMQNAGGKEVDFDHLAFASNDPVILPVENCDVFYPPSADQMTPWFEYDCEPSTFLSTMNKETGAGFYIAGLGPMPYAFGNVLTHHYVIYRAK